MDGAFFLQKTLVDRTAWPGQEPRSTKTRVESGPWRLGDTGRFPSAEGNHKYSRPRNLGILRRDVPTNEFHHIKMYDSTVGSSVCY